MAKGKAGKIDFAKFATKVVIANAAGAGTTFLVSGLQKIPKLATKPIAVTSIIEAIGLGLTYFGNKNENMQAAGYAMQGIAGYRYGTNIVAKVQAGADDTMEGTMNAPQKRKLEALKRMHHLSKQSAGGNGRPGWVNYIQHGNSKGPATVVQMPKKEMGERREKRRRSAMYYCA